MQEAVAQPPDAGAEAKALQPDWEQIRAALSRVFAGKFSELS